MFCASCGKEISGDARFCLYCGAEQIKIMPVPEPDKKEEISGRVHFGNGFDTNGGAEEKREEDPVKEDYTAVWGEEGVNDMIYCPFCGAANPGDSVFCEECGKNMSGVESVVPEVPVIPRVPEVHDDTRFCPFCGSKNKYDSVFCESCGKNMNKRPNPVKPIIIKMVAALIAVAAIVAAFLVIKPIIISHRGGQTKFIYAEDGSLYMIDAKKPKKSTELEGDYYSSLQYALDKSSVTPDGKYLCYPSKSNNEQYPYNLYMQKVKSKEEAVKIASNVRDFQLLDNGKVVYVDQNDTLYITDYKENKKKLSEVSYWEVTENQKYLIWEGAYNKNTVEYEGLYYIDTALKHEKEKITSALSGIFYMTPNAERIVFFEGDDLFSVDNFGKKEKIAKDIKGEPYLESNGDVYYAKAIEGRSVYEMIDDDLTDKGSVSYPNQTDYEREVQQTSEWWGSYTSTEVDWDAYNAAMDEYNAYQKADSVRKYLKDSSKTGDFYYQLCMYSKGKEKVLEPDALSQTLPHFTYSTLLHKRLPSIAYYRKAEKPIATLSDLCSSIVEQGSSSSDVSEYQIENALFKYISEECDYMYCGKNGAVPINKELVMVFSDESGKNGYGFIWEDNKQALYSFALSGEKAGKCVLYAEDICGYSDSDMDSVWIDHDDIYYKAGADDSYNLYKNRKVIAEDIDYSGSLLLEDGVLYYTSDLNSEEQTCTLYKYDNGKNIALADDVYDYHPFDSDTVAILADYSDDRGKGTLKIYNGKKMVSVSDDVQAIS